MKTGICSFSFNRSFAAGDVDMFSYIETCAEGGSQDGAGDL